MEETIQKIQDLLVVYGIKVLAALLILIIGRWIAKAPDYWGVFFDTTEKLKKTLDAKGISIPFPQRDVHLFQQKPGAA